MKIILVVILSLFGVACDPLGGDSSSSKKQAAAAYLSCEAVPSGAVTDHFGCPGAAGTWNNYEVKINSNGDVISIDLYCGGGDNEHPTDQAGYDGYVGVGETSNSDYKSSADCVSGTRTEDSTGDITANIWQKI